MTELLDTMPEDLGFDDLEFSGIVTWDAAELDKLVNDTITFGLALVGRTLFPYQLELAYRIIEAVYRNDGDTITALQSRQSGKTETLAFVIVTLMVLLPRLAKTPRYAERLKKFKNGYMVGVFAPVDSQAQTIFSRIVEFLRSADAKEMFDDPEIDEEVEGGNGKLVTLKECRSFVRMQTAHPKASIESKSYHFILIDECQTADEQMVNKSIRPMGAFYRAVKVYTGTTHYQKGVFYKAIQTNKRAAVERGGRRNHFEFDWRYCARYNPDYLHSVRDDMTQMGEDSDEFLMAYCLKWPLEAGMFTTEERLKELSDPEMDMQPYWFEHPLIAGLDVGRKVDSTVLTVVWTDPTFVDQFGYRDHRILNWLEIRGDRWEEQYEKIVAFLKNYSVTHLAIDGNGGGDVVADRLERLLPDISILPLGASPTEQSLRWKHLLELINRGLVSWPGSRKARRNLTHKRFLQQMTDLEKEYRGSAGVLMAAAPRAAGAHDDFPDSLANAVWLTKDATMPTVQSSNNVFYGGAGGGRRPRSRGAA